MICRFMQSRSPAESRHLFILIKADPEWRDLTRSPKIGERVLRPISDRLQAPIFRPWETSNQPSNVADLRFLQINLFSFLNIYNRKVKYANN